MMTTAGYSHLHRQAAALKRELRQERQELGIEAPAPRSAVELARDLGIALDPWQARTLGTDARNVLMLVSRQGGKSTVGSVMGLHEAVYAPGSLTLILSPTERQSKRLLRTIRKYYESLRALSPATSDGLLSLELRNGSEIHALPGSEATIRGFSSVDLLLIDEAALVDDDLYASVRPMLAVSGGRLVAMTSPRGQRGFFYREWTEGGDAWHREIVTAYEVPRIARAWLEAERKRIGNWWFEQEYLCLFKDTDDQVFASDHIARALADDLDPLFGADDEGNDLIEELAPLFAEMAR